MTDQPSNTTRASHGDEFRKGWKIVLSAAVGAGAGVTGVNMYSLGLFLIPLTTYFGWSRTQVSAAKTFITLGFILTAPIVGILADKYGVRKLGLLSMAALAIAFLAMTQITDNIATFYFGLFVLASAGGGTTALVWTRGVSGWFAEKRGIALALTLTGTGIAGVITPPLIGGLIDAYGWQAGYMGIAAIAALAVIPVYFLFFEKDRRASLPNALESIAPLQPGLSLAEALRTRQFWQNGLAFALVGAIVSSLTVHLIPLLSDAGLTREIAVGVAGVLGIAVITGRLLTGYLVDRFHPPYVAGLFLILPALGMAILLVAPSAVPLIVIAVILIGFAAGSEVDLLPYLTAHYFGLRAYGRIYAWQFVMFYSGVGVGPVSFGWAYDTHGSYSLALTVGMPILAAGALGIATLGHRSRITSPDTIRPETSQASPAGG